MSVLSIGRSRTNKTAAVLISQRLEQLCYSLILTNLVTKASVNIDFNVSTGRGMKWKDSNQPPFMFNHTLPERQQITTVNWNKRW